MPAGGACRSRTSPAESSRDLPLDSSRERVRCICCSLVGSTRVDGPRKKDNDPTCALCSAALAFSLSACTNPYAALVGAYWGRLLVLPLERRRVAGQEPPSE